MLYSASCPRCRWFYQHSNLLSVRLMADNHAATPHPEKEDA